MPRIDRHLLRDVAAGRVRRTASGYVLRMIPGLSGARNTRADRGVRELGDLVQLGPDGVYRPTGKGRQVLDA